jgi:hypothetical protein
VKLFLKHPIDKPGRLFEESLWLKKKKKLSPMTMKIIPGSTCMNPEDRGSKFLRNSYHSQNYIVLQCRGPDSKKHNSFPDNTVRTIISAPPLQNAVSHTTEERMQLLPNTAVPCGGVTHGILQRWRAYDFTHCISDYMNVPNVPEQADNSGGSYTGDLSFTLSSLNIFSRSTGTSSWWGGGGGSPKKPVCSGHKNHSH